MKFNREPFAQECWGPLVVPVAVALGASATTAAAIGTAVTVAATVASTAFAVASARAAGQAQVGAATFNAQVAEQNEVLARQQTETLKQQNELQLSQADRDRRLRLSANVAAGGASGLGQPLDILRDNAGQEELQILQIQHQGTLEQRAGEISAAGFGTQAELELSKARVAAGKASIGVGTTLLTGASKLTTVLGNI